MGWPNWCNSNQQIVISTSLLARTDLSCRGVDNEGDYEIIKALGERVDEVVQEDVMLLKADVEGFEPGVIESAKGLLDSHE